MPDHLHAIVFITQNDQEKSDLSSQRAPRSIATLISGFKGAVTRRISEARGIPTVVWQRNYFERIIRDEAELQATRRYILENPQRWQLRNETDTS